MRRRDDEAAAPAVERTENAPFTADGIPRALWWDATAAALRLIDQTRLPAHLELLTCVGAAEVAEAIRALRVRGAPALGVAAAYGLALGARETLGTDLPLAPEEALAQLTAYKGVGRWTAEYVLMRGFGAPDSLPAADVGLRAIIGRAYGLGRTATEAEVRERAEVWAGWRGWAAFTWWLALQRETESGPAGTRR